MYIRAHTSVQTNSQTETRFSSSCTIISSSYTGISTRLWNVFRARPPSLTTPPQPLSRFRRRPCPKVRREMLGWARRRWRTLPGFWHLWNRCSVVYPASAAAATTMMKLVGQPDRKWKKKKWKSRGSYSGFFFLLFINRLTTTACQPDIRTIRRIRT